MTYALSMVKKILSRTFYWVGEEIQKLPQEIQFYISLSFKRRFDVKIKVSYLVDKFDIRNDIAIILVAKNDIRFTTNEQKLIK